MSGEDGPVGIVPAADSPMWDIRALSSFWLVDLVVEGIVEARGQRIADALGDQLNPN